MHILLKNVLIEIKRVEASKMERNAMIGECKDKFDKLLILGFDKTQCQLLFENVPYPTVHPTKAVVPYSISEKGLKVLGIFITLGVTDMKYLQFYMREKDGAQVAIGGRIDPCQALNLVDPEKEEYSTLSHQERAWETLLALSFFNVIRSVLAIPR